MAIPDYQSLMRPVLTAFDDGAVHRGSDAVQKVAAVLHLSADDLAEMLPSGTAPTFSNRAHWCLTYLTLAALLHRPQKAHYQITDLGRTALDSGPERMTVSYLTQFPEYQAYQAKKASAKAALQGGAGDIPDSEATRLSRWKRAT